MIDLKKYLLMILALFFLLSGCTDATVSSVKYAGGRLELNVLFRDDVLTRSEPIPSEMIPSQPEAVAEKISFGYNVLLGMSDVTQFVSDSNHLSYRTVFSEQTLSVRSEKAVGSVYLEWFSLPGEYLISWEGGSVQCGSEGFLHDYIRFPEEVFEFSFVFFGEDPKKLCDIELYTSGASPSDVQDWQLPCERADILFFPTHADDDVVFFGPLISYYSIERGFDVQTAFMVDHYRYPERNHERLNALWEMGVRHYPVIFTAPDYGEKSLYDALLYYKDYDIVGWQMDTIRRFQPMVVVGHDIDGEYGNGGHKVNTYYLIQAVELASDPEQYPDSASLYGVWDTPKFYLHYYEENDWLFDVNTPMIHDPQGRTPFEVAQDATLYHASQFIYPQTMSQDESRFGWNCRPYGLYRSLVGYDTVADLMQNIVPEDWR